MREVKVITSHVPGSSASKIAMQNEIHGLMMEKGLPGFYVTINPADMFNPLVKFLAGSEIDIDNLLPDKVPIYILFLIHSEFNGLEPKMDTFLVKVN